MRTPTPDPAVARPHGAGRRWLAWALVLVAGVLTLGSWALASPVGSSPDDDYHLASIWCARGIDPSRCLEVPGNPNGRVLPALASGAAPCFSFDFTKSGDCQLPLTEPAPTVATEHGNWQPSYPPLFYRAMSVFITGDIAGSVLMMRMAVGLVALAVLGALAAALPRPHRYLASVPLLITGVPLGVSLLASTNPSSWTLVGVATLFPAAYFSFETQGRRQWALAAIAVVGALLAAGSRADACLFVVMSAVLVLMLRIRRLRDHPVPVAALVLCLAVAAWFFLNAGHAAVISGNMGSATEPDRAVGQLILLNLGSLPVLWVGGFGSGIMGQLGWLDTPLPPLVGFSVIAVWLAFVLQGLRRTFPAKVLALILVGLALVVFPLVLLVQTKVLVGVVVQPRYVLPLLTLFTLIALLIPRGATEGWRLGRVPFWAAVAALTTANAISLHIQLRRYVTGLDVSAVDLGPDQEWWWSHGPGPMAVWLLGSAAFAVLAYVLLSQVREQQPGPLPGRRELVSAWRSSDG